MNPFAREVFLARHGLLPQASPVHPVGERCESRRAAGVYGTRVLRANERTYGMATATGDSLGNRWVDSWTRSPSRGVMLNEIKLHFALANVHI